MREAGFVMTIALVAHDAKKELMVQFCIAYRSILASHRLIATGTTGRLVSEATGLEVQRFMPASMAATSRLPPASPVMRWTCCSSSAIPSPPSPANPTR